MQASKELSTGVFRQEHFDIRDNFRQRVIQMLQSPEIELKGYAADSDYRNREALKFKIADGVELEITLYLDKNLSAQELPF